MAPEVENLELDRLTNWYSKSKFNSVAQSIKSYHLILLTKAKVKRNENDVAVDDDDDVADDDDDVFPFRRQTIEQALSDLYVRASHFVLASWNYHLSQERISRWKT